MDAIRGSWLRPCGHDGGRGNDGHGYGGRGYGHGYGGYGGYGWYGGGAFIGGLAAGAALGSYYDDYDDPYYGCGQVWDPDEGAYVPAGC